MAKYAVPSDQLALHADRGGPMKATALMLADLGVIKSHSRPHRSNDNRFSKAHFKTLKYQMELQKTAPIMGEARIFCRCFFVWYNEGHHHAGIVMTPDQIHFGQASATRAARKTTLDAGLRNTPNGLSVTTPNRPRSRLRSGSTRQGTPRKSESDFENPLSQSC